ncbi:MAG: serine hydrolase domain-containing protein [Pseudomonadota bacterium]|nr:serine hydrolase domain-containing protein [Pseudomonadota bacterium]
MTVEELGAFLEPTLTMQLALFGIPGAAVAVVQGDRTLYLGGLGKADLASDEPTSARETLFRTGSVSKLVTWTAVMQHVEQGKLDLHADVNRYLDAFQIPATPSPSPWRTCSPTRRASRTGASVFTRDRKPTLCR